MEDFLLLHIGSIICATYFFIVLFYLGLLHLALLPVLHPDPDRLSFIITWVTEDNIEIFFSSRIWVMLYNLQFHQLK